MYNPESFKIVDESEIAAFLERHDFVTIVSSTGDSLIASHVPVVVRREASGLALFGHLARENSHWKSMDGATESLAIFQGPQAYVSPTWYANSPAVPTWNYAVAHAYGRPQVRHDQPFLEEVLRGLLSRYEEGRAESWRLENLPHEYRDQALSRIVAFEMPVLRVEAKFKLSQNRAAVDRAGAIQGLEREDSAEAASLAKFMRSYLKDG